MYSDLSDVASKTSRCCFHFDGKLAKREKIMKRVLLAVAIGMALGSPLVSDGRQGRRYPAGQFQIAGSISR